ncbi:diaminopimelate epimerase [Thiococcus pfennigii]|uniref:diaminopimelate epimerase n=1 Tax=Thiococcus pfennigii TaxID=1057 RepID=UPI001907B234|nr:diaminopimelate epimerase [Thiococcus pfennigii]MBK1702693.1 diaminopimelate epimerase [Thiococcus pfennigii]MBK1733428.1 diaminopimelate epimerase [Thiococcus pfennigii]
MIRFTKMHGLGNDFVVLDGVRQSLDLSPAQIRTLADRHFGIGCDQVLLVEPPRRPGSDFFYRIFNADGSEAGQCGNGARCFARFVRDQGLSEQDRLRVDTRDGTLELALLSDGEVRVDMGAPRLEPREVPFAAAARAGAYVLSLGGETLAIGAVSLGNPHAVTLVEDIDTAPVAELGPRIAGHPDFPEGVNAGFLQVLAADTVRLRVFERGVGETLACGSGACAAVVCGRLWGLLGEHVQVELPGGTLAIEWAGGDAPIWMTGPAARVFDGEIAL